MSSQPIQETFEGTFLDITLRRHVEHCNHYELVACFRRWLGDHGPILEAGCGSGRWVIWFEKQGWDAVGLDWSETLCSRARLAYPESAFVAGDFCHTPFDDGYFGSVVSLGAIEHDVEGPMAALREFHRLLRPGGVAIITVPYLGLVRWLVRAIKSPLRRFKRLLHRDARRNLGHKGYCAAMRKTATPWAVDLMPTPEGWSFFQYNFSKNDMRTFFRDADFQVIEEFVDFGDEGVLHNFGRCSGTYDQENGCVRFSAFGRCLRRVVPVSMNGHMLCYVVRRNR